MPDESSIYGTNTNGEAILRTSENAEGDPTSIYGVNSDGKACMRVSSDVTSDDPTSIYGVNGSGEACVRIEGSGGGEPIKNQDKTITTNGSYTADEGYTGLGTVTVNVPNPSTGTKDITSNGTYDVTNFASANVNVPTTAPAHYIEKVLDANGKLTSNSSNFMDFTGVRDIGNWVFSYQYYQNHAISTVNFGSLTSITGDNACSNMFNLSYVTSVDLSLLTTITGINACSRMFNASSNLANVYLNSLTTVTGYRACENMFTSTRIASLDLPSLVTVGDQSLMNFIDNNPHLTNVNLPLLKTVGTKGFRYAFMGDTSLTTLSFPSLTTVASDSFQSMLNNVTGCTVHFPSNLSGTTGLDAATIGGTNTTVLFDLPATE